MQEAVTNSGVPDLDDATVTTIGNDQVRVQTRTLDSMTEVPLVRTAIANEAGVPTDQVNYSLIGASWGGQITERALIALVVFLVLVTLVIWIYFRDAKMSVAALVALLHDLVLTVGIYALVGFTVTPATLIGVLTILGYSLYDTVVVFDKVRENVRDLTSSARQDLLRGGQPGGQPGAGPLDQHHDHRRAAGRGAAVRRRVHPGGGPPQGPGAGAVRRHDLGRLLLDLHRHAAARPAQGAGAGHAEADRARVQTRRAKTEAKVGAPVPAGAGSAAPGVAAYEPPEESAGDDTAEPGDPTGTSRTRITVSSAQPTIVNRPTRPTSEGASERPQPQNKPRSQRKK